jgi:hypothetical protein
MPSTMFSLLPRPRIHETAEAGVSERQEASHAALTSGGRDHVLLGYAGKVRADRLA